MRHLLNALRRPLRRRAILQLANYKPQNPQAAPSPPSLPKPPKKPVSFSLHGESWSDDYNWMSQLSDRVAMRHMDVYMEQEEKYTEAVMSTTDRLQSKLHAEMASRFAADLSTPPLRWGPWLYYRRVEEGMQYSVLCRRLASLNEEFISNKSPSAGFDFTSGKKIEQKLLDYNKEAERFGGYAYEELSEVSPDHRYLAYTMYDKDNDHFKLSVRDLNSGSLCNKPQADRVSSIAWAKNGQALLYAVTDDKKRPFRIYCSMLGSDAEDVMILEEPQENVHLTVRHTKDFQFLTVNLFTTQTSKVFLLNAANPLSGMTLVWEGEPNSHCIIEHHQGYLYLFTNAALQGQPVDNHYLLCSPVASSCIPRNWQNVFAHDQQMSIVDVDFCSTHLVLIVRNGRKYELYSLSLPLDSNKVGALLKDFNLQSLPLPDHVAQILPGSNYDFYSSTMRVTVTSPVMPDAVVDYDLLNGKWTIVQQQNLLYERTRVLYGASAAVSSSRKTSISKNICADNAEDDRAWNDLSEYYACEEYDVPSHDGVSVPLTILYSRHKKITRENPGLLHGHGAYGEILDKRWRNELKSLLDRGWVIAYADVRGGGGGGRKWCYDGRRTKKINSVKDYISCAKFLIEREIVGETKLAGWGYSAGGLLVASALNFRPDLFRAAVLKVPFLDPTHTLLLPVLPLTPNDYEEFGYPGDIEDFRAIREFSPYDNILKDAVYPATLVTSSFSTRFGVWESAKWVARLREYTVHDPSRPVLLNLTTDIVEENRYLHCKEAALESAFLIKFVDDQS
ncbi:protease 2 isoform X1 [Salvia hispanica]|uniref:protease 2 isoform X1 n=1 Tax=Salvia hispanica TaxID=49212 RepID=UPI00200977B5|nr:protease 2 isoform X1 [Salvia hispanica]